MDGDEVVLVSMRARLWDAIVSLAWERGVLPEVFVERAVSAYVHDRETMLLLEEIVETP